jgi:NADPH:quinone reductase-like Zn-dependent oxidoreductase
MKALQLREFGVEHMQVATVADPSPGQGEVLIATEAATVNPADFALASGAVAARPLRPTRPGGISSAAS